MATKQVSQWAANHAEKHWSRLKNRMEQIEDKWKATPQRVETRDTLFLTMGIIGVLASVAVFFRFPHYMSLIYMSVYPLVFSWTSFNFTARHAWGFYLFDFCYFANLSCMIFLIFFGTESSLFVIVFGLCTGPLLFAHIPWRISLVFHSHERMGSLFIHTAAPIVLYNMRWNVPGPEQWIADPGFVSLYLLPVAGYCVWQLLYIGVTEFAFSSMLKADLSLETSVRSLMKSQGPKSPYLLAFRRVGMFGPSELFDPENLKTRVAFWLIQLCYTCLTCGLAALAYLNYAVHTVLIMSIIGHCIWHGSAFYIKIFGHRYADEVRAKVAHVEAKQRSSSATRAPEDRLTMSSSSSSSEAGRGSSRGSSRKGRGGVEQQESRSDNDPLRKRTRRQSF